MNPERIVPGVRVRERDATDPICGPTVGPVVRVTTRVVWIRDENDGNAEVGIGRWTVERDYDEDPLPDDRDRWAGLARAAAGALDRIGRHEEGATTLREAASCTDAEDIRKTIDEVLDIDTLARLPADDIVRITDDYRSIASSTTPPTP